MRAAIYARVGNPDQVAVQNQTNVLTGQIRGMWGDSTEIDIYADNGISGLQTDRPGLQKLLQEAGKMVLDKINIDFESRDYLPEEKETYQIGEDGSSLLD